VYSHIVSEALNNVCQHSEAAGFCAAQFYPQTREVRFCIGDFGCGLRQALQAFAPENDYMAVLKALEVGVTGRQVRIGQREMRNRGIGLSAIHRLVEDNDGSLTVWSGTGIFRTTPLARSDSMPYWPGTLVAAKMQRNILLRAFRDTMRSLEDELKARGRANRRRDTRSP
jgi:hypothetical protein